jgi:enoyl-[acyl-carrier protein] reductase II
MAGQSVGLVDKVQPLNEIIEELVSDAETELQRLKSIFNQECSP